MLPPAEPATARGETQTETPRQAARRDTILQIARVSFLEEGYAATSMSSIAAKLGGSKGTLYNYYASKEELFAAVMTAHCAVARARLEVLDTLNGSLAERLRRFGEAYLDVILDEEFLSVHRLVTGESGRFPEIGATFYEAAGKRGKSRLSEVSPTKWTRASSAGTTLRRWRACSWACCARMFIRGAPGM